MKERPKMNIQIFQPKPASNSVISSIFIGLGEFWEISMIIMAICGPNMLLGVIQKTKKKRYLKIACLIFMNMGKV